MGFSRQEYWSGLPLPSPTLWADRKQKKLTLWSVISYSKQQQWIVMCNKKVDFRKQLVKPALWVDQEVPKEFPKPNLHEKNVMVTVWWSLACLILYSFLNPSETNISEKYSWQTDEMHQKLQCLQPRLVNRKDPILLHDNTWQCHTTKASKVEQIGLQSFASSTIFTWPLANQLHFFEHLNNFLQGKCFHNQQEAENAF